MLRALARRSTQTLRQANVAQVRTTGVRSFSVCDTDYVEPPVEKTDKGAIIVNNVAFTLEWILSSPPPLHAFEEPPIIVEWPEGEDGHH